MASYCSQVCEKCGASLASGAPFLHEICGVAEGRGPLRPVIPERTSMRRPLWMILSPLLSGENHQNRQYDQGRTKRSLGAKMKSEKGRVEKKAFSHRTKYIALSLRLRNARALAARRIHALICPDWHLVARW